MVPRRSKWLYYWGPALGFLALIFIVSQFPLGRYDISVPRGSDKMAHGIEYAILCLLLFRAFRAFENSWVRRWAPLLALLAASLYGATDELHQYFVPARSSDVYDWLVDTLGAAVVAALAAAWLRWRRPAAAID